MNAKLDAQAVEKAAGDAVLETDPGTARKQRRSEVLLLALPENIRVTITDNGHGITPRQVQDCFLPVNRKRRLDEDGGESRDRPESGKRHAMGRKGLANLPDSVQRSASRSKPSARGRRSPHDLKCDTRNWPRKSVAIPPSPDWISSTIPYSTVSTPTTNRPSFSAHGRTSNRRSGRCWSMSDGPRVTLPRSSSPHCQSRLASRNRRRCRCGYQVAK